MTVWRRSLVVRLLATSTVIAVCAIAATAWLAVQTTTRTLRQEQGQELADDRALYDLLLGHAATHSNWDGVAALLHTGRTDRRFTLLAGDGTLIAETAPGPSLRDARPSALIDPLNVELSITGGTERIDPRAVGPYRLTAAEAEYSQERTLTQMLCLRSKGFERPVVTLPSGRAVVRDENSGTCEFPVRLTPTETGPLRELTAATARCAGLTAGAREIWFEPAGFGFTEDAPARGQRLRDCAFQARQAQLRPYVAPVVLLFVTDTDTATPPAYDLSRGNLTRIAIVTTGVLAAAILITVLAGRRLVRPLSRLTEAAVTAGEFPVPPDGRRDEIGHLAAALHDLESRRLAVERRRREMISDVAHELRTPLTTMRSWLEAAQDGLTPIDRPLVDLLLDEAVLLQRVINDLRDLAAADAGDLRLRPAGCDMAEVLRQVADAHRGPAAQAGVTLAVPESPPVPVTADPDRLRQILGNLVTNAVRHTPAGGTVTLRPLPDGAEVQDTGSGIPPDELPRIFDRFWRGDASRSRVTGGSGLGLPIARTLARAHGGDLTARSTPGAGSVFRLLLPAVAPGRLLPPAVAPGGLLPPAAGPGGLALPVVVPGDRADPPAGGRTQEMEDL
ncbi:HAMP domain-containing sensor histidine kinase [Actinoplanes couchii]|uniref:HAMP domain-containing sensor histidine kinase n=1 Tax=Actinoplanes couchii TaxID=403638 RepID=UPI001EF28A87|nr:HAMP domain-containing sensor histidine kinase [Actinoplanes couchii]MDR6317078.1 two-component system sensor histidine kinase BaeS [Actinoplanes couchii]